MVGQVVMKKQVFISGPILGMEKDQDYYRNIITETSQRLGFDVIDPWKREKYLYKDDNEINEKFVQTAVGCEKYGFIQRDLDDAKRCDIMVVYLPKLSAGACMEMFYAKREGKTVIVVSDMGQLSPWIIGHCDVIIRNF